MHGIFKNLIQRGNNMPGAAKLLYYLILLLSLFPVLTSYSQNKFNVTIQLDSNINAHNVTCQYYNGKNNVEVTDTFTNNTLTAKGSFFNEKVTFTIFIRNNNIVIYKDEFLLTEKPAKITIYYTSKIGNKMYGNKNVMNALPALDETYNSLYNKLLKHRIKESTALSELWKNDGDKIGENDSITQQSTKLFKILNKRTILCLKEHAQNYYSFWYFKYQIVYPAITMIRDDKSYFKELIAVLKTTFPEKYTKSNEGENLIREMDIYANPPLKEGVAAPVFEMADIAGDPVNTSTHNSKYLLLNFWQTWCPPCIREIPSLIELKEKYASDKLEIISISNETDSNKVSNFIKVHNMSWTNIRDKDDQLRYLFRVNAYPTTILIDNKGIIKHVMTGLSDTGPIRKIIDEQE